MNVFGSGACICTCSAVLLNLHCKTVWNSDIISRNFKYIGPISWAIPMVMTVVALDLTEISYEFGSACFLKHRRALIIFFYPYLPVIGLGVLLHASTLMYVCKIAFLADRHAIFIPSETITGSWDGTSGTRRRVLQLWKTSWRSMALVTVYLASFAYYWYFYVQDAIPQKISMDTKVSWLTCILSPGGSQEKCSPIITPSVTSLRLLILAEMIPGLLGTWTFIIFGFRKAILAEWKEFFRIRRSRWFNLSRERRRQRRKDVRPACPISTAVANRRRTYRSPTAARNSLLDPEYEIDVQAENQPHLPYAFDGPMAGKPVEGLAWPVRAAGREMSRAAGLDGSLTNPFIVKSSHHRGRTDGSHTNIDDLLTNSSLTSLSRGTTVLKDEEESGGLPLALLPSTVTRASLSSQRSDTTTLTYPSPPSRHISHLSYFSVTPPNETQQAHDELDLQQRLSHSQLQYSTQSPWR
ncbi:uncharacterized protein EV422DRAFT_527058 [Fimicolochytrium jonesii]|uniref:uncharacterized protein n=1 Tax=Fimicolochytrium jonesii TaxID=1396493 RepID=UPI0022FE7125|nr:uncharacterized protein EV422DRAFT_527058 [Fimicolochytrium jonesii]KAI8821805.1 hypothetical protein EV422DRAFT_527058 [Fimicolochytrium jonesii]